MTFDQHESDVRFEWEEHGVATLAPISDAVIIVDVLSFSTSIEIAVNRGAMASAGSCAAALRVCGIRLF